MSIKKSFQSNKLFVTVDTLCDIFLQDINNFLALIFKKKKIGFSLIDKIYAYIFAGFCFHLIANHK